MIPNATAVVAGSVDTRSSPETKGADEVSFFAADAELSSTRPLQVKGFGKHGLTADPQVHGVYFTL